MTDVPRIRADRTAPVVQDAERRLIEEAEDREEHLLRIFDVPIHDLPAYLYGEDEEGALWVHLMADHGEGPHSLDYATLGELRWAHADAHEDEDARASTIRTLAVRLGEHSTREHLVDLFGPQATAALVSLVYAARDEA